MCHIGTNLHLQLRMNLKLKKGNALGGGRYLQQRLGRRITKEKLMALASQLEQPLIKLRLAEFATLIL